MQLFQIRKQSIQTKIGQIVKRISKYSIFILLNELMKSTLFRPIWLSEIFRRLFMDDNTSSYPSTGLRDKSITSTFSSIVKIDVDSSELLDTFRTFKLNERSTLSSSMREIRLSSARNSYVMGKIFNFVMPQFRTFTIRAFTRKGWVMFHNGLFEISNCHKSA